MSGLNSHRHFFLYAKGHYQKTEVVEDLGKICTNYLSHDLHSPADRIRILVHALSTVRKPLVAEQVLAEVLEASFQFNHPFDFGKHEVTGTQAVIIAVLQILRHCTVHEIEGSLGEADFSILPPPVEREVKANAET